MALQNVCDSLVEETDGLLACIVLDLDTGLTLATSCRKGMDSASINAVASRLGGLFRSRSMALSIPGHVGGRVQEAQVTSGNAYHFMATVPGWSNALLVFVTEKVVSIGLGWMAVHQAFDRLLQARPGTASTEAVPEAPTPPPAAPPDTPAPPAERPPEPLRGVGPAATSPVQQPSRHTAMPPAAETPRRQAPPPPAAPPPQVTQPAPPPAGSPDSDPLADVGRARKSTESVPAVGTAEPPTLPVPDAREQRTGRQAPKVRPRATSPISAAGKKPVPPPDEEDAKTDVGRMGARAVFGSKTRRS